MAPMKAFENDIQKKCEKEAVDFVANWCRSQKLKVYNEDIFVIWFAYTNRGYRCMLGTHINQNLFFELSVNKRTKDIQCDCYKRFEHIAMNGSEYETTGLTDRPLKECIYS